MNTPGTIAARAINAHPWLDAVYPELDDTDLLISPPWPAERSDRPGGHIEGRATWNTTSTGTVNYHIALALEPLDGDTVEDQSSITAPAWELAWVDLARHIAAKLAELRAAV